MTTNTRTWHGLTIPTAGTFALDPAHTRVGFVIRHLVVSKVRGAFKDVAGEIVIAEEPLDSSVTATIQAASIDTGVADRDNHLRTGDFLEIEKYPELSFRSTGLRAKSGEHFILVGELTIKDVTKQVELELEFGGVQKSPYGQEVIGFSATTEIDREEYNVTWNQTLETGGVMLGKTLKIEIEGEAVRQA
ncbi:YceI family protein [Catellatospora sp. NPDC049609]|uniref:YceI family protein n=1 Tax=Catellatospora sp. NPDC049609 TaxID=3155505 RepID=UPI003439BF10